ncbi:MAG: hypothetical protein OEV66_09235 [Spirochaetia bacterium]|nr:hypothetical protein [Spirochaetia bacterium]
MLNKGNLLKDISFQIRGLFHRLALTGESLHAQSPISIAQRAILESMYISGRQTIPSLAKNRSVSRQFIQKNVNGLTRKKFVKILENPEHKRSFYIELTDAGRELIGEFIKKENMVFQELAKHYSLIELENALSLLKRFDKHLQNYDGKAK